MILIKKAGDGSKKIKGCWDSIHVVEVQEKSSGRSAHYKLTSTSMLWLQTNKVGSGTMNLGGSLTRQVRKCLLEGEKTSSNYVTSRWSKMPPSMRLLHTLPTLERWLRRWRTKSGEGLQLLLSSGNDLNHLIICRNTLNQIYFGKTRDIVNGLRSVKPLADGKQQEELRKDLMTALAKKNAGKSEG